MDLCAGHDKIDGNRLGKTGSEKLAQKVQFRKFRSERQASSSMILRQISNFNIRQIAESGQCFRIIQEPANSRDLRLKAAPENTQNFRLETEPAGGQPDTVWRMISGSHYLRLLENKNGIYFFCPEEEFPFWENYFDLAEDYGLFLSSVQSGDPYLKKAAEYGSGIRILRQDLWEMIITFVISQQKTIPAIRSLVEALAKTYGQKLAIPKECQELPFSSDCRDVDCGFFYAFPTPEELAQASLSELQSMKLGYRAKYIKRLCEDACSGALDLAHLSRLGYQDAMDYLQGFYGIGEKVANCICLFGLHHIDAFPVDTWIRKILLREYAPKSRRAKSVPQTRLCQELVQENFSCYKGFAGVMQQYIFYYERSHS